jgi:hypothetical protein
MDYKLTMLCPGIRTEKWERLYNSVIDSFHGDFEMIFISPYEFPDKLKQVKGNNVRLIHDWGTPIRCQQIGLIESKGEWIAWTSDDGVFLPGALDKAFEIVKDKDYKTIVTGKYTEGDNAYSMLNDKYYILNNHDACNLPFVPRETYMLNVGIVSRQLLIELGGWDCQFEVCPMAYNDFAIRAKNYGAEFIMQDELMFKCSHLPGTMGDHGPIHYAQTQHDQPIFTLIYCDEEKSKRTTIDIENWKNVPSRWERRFGKS